LLRICCAKWLETCAHRGKLMGSDARQRLAGAALVNATWWSAATGLYPTRALRQVGLVGDPPLHGERTASVAASGPRSALLGPGVDSRALDQPTGHEPLIEEFDRMAEVYELFVAPLSRPIFEEVLAVLRPGWRRTPVRWTPPAVRVVSSARSHNSSHTGEVVGVDLAAGMVAAAARVFNGSFDLVYSVLAHHHFPDSAAAAGAFRCIRPGGLYAVIDPGPA
jgi:hypothetical protein